MIKSFNKVVTKCRQSGFGYLPIQEIISGRNPDELLARVRTASNANSTKETAEALLGAVPILSPSLKALKEEYFRFERSNKGAYSDNQWRKWINPRNSAVDNFIKVVGNKPASTISRKDILSFRQWWADKVMQGYSANTANKQFSIIRQILQYAADNHQLEIKTDDLFRKISLKDVQKVVRKAFDPSFIQNKLLQNDKYSPTDECFLFICAMADTGARISELVGLDDSG